MKKLILLILIVVGTVFYTYQKARSNERIDINKQEISIPSKITSEEAVSIVKKLPEVQEYLKKVPNGKVKMDNESEGEYNIHVYEVKNGHTATFNWYTVNTIDGKIKPQFTQ